jgi:hypothetical protein
MASKPKASPAPERKLGRKPERRGNPREGRPALTDAERALPGYARTVDEWPAGMLRPLGKIPRYTNNPRDNDPAVPDLMASLGDHGAQQPIVVRAEDGIIIVGDTRWLAAERLGWPAFPVKIMPCDESEARAYRLRDNKTGERAEWNYPKLKIEFEAMRDAGLDLTRSGFRDFEISPILMSEWTPPASQPLASGLSATEPGKPEDERGQKPIAKFDGEQWPRVLAAIERMRERAEAPQMEFAEALTRICMFYMRTEAPPA